MANEKLGVATEPSPESLQLSVFAFAQWGLTIGITRRTFPALKHLMPSQTI